MTIQTKNQNPKPLLINFVVAALLAVTAFGHRHPSFGFGYRFIVLAFLTAVWVSLWRSLAHKFHWGRKATCLIPTALFLIPLAGLHALDPRIGQGKGDWFSGIVLLSAVAFACVVQTTSAPQAN